MSELVDNIWEAAASKANNPSRLIRVSHWGAAKWRKIKKPRNVVKTGTTVATAFVPLSIPLWTSTVDYIVQKVENNIRASYRTKKLAGLDPDDLVKQVKHGIKDIDISKMDRARYKSQHGWGRLDHFFRGSDHSLSKCVGVFQYALQFHYLRRRMIKLRLQATVMQEVSNSILQWCGEVEKRLEAVEPHIKSALEDRLDHEPGECGGAGASSGCFNAEGNASKLEASLQKLAELP